MKKQLLEGSKKTESSDQNIAQKKDKKKRYEDLSSESSSTQYANSKLFAKRPLKNGGKSTQKTCFKRVKM
jgi:hypothetical protein